MSKLTRFLNFFRINKSIAIDLGTSNVLIYDKQKNKIVLNEPSVIVKDRKTGELIAVGKKSKGNARENSCKFYSYKTFEGRGNF